MTIQSKFPEMTEFIEPFIEVCHALYKNQYVCAYDGNVSIRFEDKILATPTHLSKGLLTKDDLIVVDLDGNQLAGNRKPTSELKVHLAVYEQNHTAKCIIHAHPLYATAIYRNGKAVDSSVLTEAEETLGTVPIVPCFAPGTKDLAQAVGKAMPEGVRACMMENHGVVVAGETLEEVYFLLTSVERLAKTEYLIANMK
jgi:L-fuculose-phosphate aldolase